RPPAAPPIVVGLLCHRTWAAAVVTHRPAELAGATRYGPSGSFTWCTLASPVPSPPPMWVFGIRVFTFVPPASSIGQTTDPGLCLEAEFGLALAVSGLLQLRQVGGQEPVAGGDHVLAGDHQRLARLLDGASHLPGACPAGQTTDRTVGDGP